MRSRRLAAWLLGLFLLPLSLCLVQVKAALPADVDVAGPQKKQQAKPKHVQVPKLSKDAIRIFLDKIEITGRVEKPQAIFIIPGRSPEVEDVRIDRSFFKEIFRKVEMPTGARKKVKQVVRSDLILW